MHMYLKAKACIFSDFHHILFSFIGFLDVNKCRINFQILVEDEANLSLNTTRFWTNLSLNTTRVWTNLSLNTTRFWTNLSFNTTRFWTNLSPNTRRFEQTFLSPLQCFEQILLSKPRWCLFLNTTRRWTNFSRKYLNKPYSNLPCWILNRLTISLSR